jgi:hypothetical protein
LEVSEDSIYFSLTTQNVVTVPEGEEGLQIVKFTNFCSADNLSKTKMLPWFRPVLRASLSLRSVGPTNLGQSVAPASIVLQKKISVLVLNYFTSN